MATIYAQGSHHEDYSKHLHISGVSEREIEKIRRDFFKDDIEDVAYEEVDLTESSNIKSPKTWQGFLREYAITDEKCRESYGWHNVRIAMYIAAAEDVKLLNYYSRTGDKANAFYKELGDIFGYSIIQSSVEGQINNFKENEKNRLTYQQDILPLAKSYVKPQ